MLTSIKIEIETRNQSAIFENVIGRHIRVPGFDVLDLHDLQIKQPFDHLEHAQYHSRRWQVGAQCLIRDTELSFFELLGIKSQIPGVDFRCAECGSCEFTELIKFSDRGRFCVARQVVQERQHLIRRLGHLGRQRQLRIVVKTQ